jgi:hypothetical protein
LPPIVSKMETCWAFLGWLVTNLYRANNSLPTILN